MDEIRIENLRSLVDTGYIKLKNINVFLGQNSSGKSTFIRTFPLLKQSNQQKTKSGILWYGPYVDFGSFKEAIHDSKSPAKDTINFTFVINDLNVEPENFHYFSKRISPNFSSTISPGRVEVTAKISKDNHQLSEYYVKIRSHIIRIVVGNGVTLEKFEIDGADHTARADLYYNFYLHYGILPVLLPASIVNESPLDAGLLKDVTNEFKTIGNFDSKTFELLTFESCVSISTLSQALRLPAILISQSMLEKVSRYVTIRALPMIWDSLRDNINNSAGGVQYVTPIRASAERYYRMQGLSVEELDPQGTNLAMFLHSLSTKEAKEFSEWTQKHMGFAVLSKSSEGHVSIVISEKDKKQVNMADTGFGFSQVVPILAQIWKSTRSDERTKRMIYYVVEQPELHLHPKMQAKLADILISAIKRGKNQNIRLVIETHSETFINQLGKAIDKSLITPDDVGIYLFEKNDSDGKTKITESAFDSQGFLTQWPYGFFDS
ncbi:AAA family ATPase [Pseudomonas germanica]|uniref:DUF3696 domain-containing protein n=1 Tax=Pseudomonas germanica TaxID=2815720 RepID=A0ABX8YKI0_9PSED|nr:DUF3696 domain-containing protein [Pseudomonas germanica]QYY80083.1 DUF3696 domain-containing protein [Pseudomonas germanica]